MADEHASIVDVKFLETARQYKSELLERMFGVSAFTAESEPGGSVLPADSNVVGVGYGAKVVAGAGVYDGPAVRVYVRAKVPMALLSGSEIVPPDVNGVPTDVVPVGDITALARPTMCGVSVGHCAITTGTLGCLVKRRDSENGDRYILSNNHVLAYSNNGVAGDAILEPGPLDGAIPTIPSPS